MLASLRLDKHPGKTFIGRIEKGFEFLGYAFSPAGLGAATKTVDNLVARACQLYEQERGAAIWLLPAWDVRATLAPVGVGG